MARGGGEGNMREPLLLKKVYYDNCPGCKLDRKKDSTPSYPVKEFVSLSLVCLSACLPISSLFPFLYFMIRDFHIAKRVEDIGFYAGFVGASYMLGRALTSVFWGIVADRYGRKPVIVFGIVSVVIFNTLFGLSTSYWMAITTRLLLGVFNGLLGPVKAYAMEVCRPEHKAIGLSLVSTAWGIGLIIGPAIGGFFAQPAEKFPSIFSTESFLGRFSYFLPCLLISFAVGVLVMCIWLLADGARTERPCGRHELPVTENIYGAMTKDDILQAQELEQQLAYQDKLMEQTKDKKNALEAFVYEVRNKLFERYRSFASKSEKEGITVNLQETEEWLYDDGDDETEMVYMSKLEDLKKDDEDATAGHWIEYLAREI